MSTPTRDVAKLTRDLIDEQWGEGDTDPRKPDYIELVTEDEQGNARKRVRRTNEYIHVAEEQERGNEYTDFQRNTRNLTGYCYVEFSTNESRSRREEMYDELDRIAVAHRKRPDTPGGWDDLKFSAKIVDDENFGWWVGELNFEYTKRKDLID